MRRCERSTILIRASHERGRDESTIAEAISQGPARRGDPGWPCAFVLRKRLSFTAGRASANLACPARDVTPRTGTPVRHIRALHQPDRGGKGQRVDLVAAADRSG